MWFRGWCLHACKISNKWLFQQQPSSLPFWGCVTFPCWEFHSLLVGHSQADLYLAIFGRRYAKWETGPDGCRCRRLVCAAQISPCSVSVFAPRGSGRARDWGGTTLVLALLHSVIQLPRKCGTFVCVACVEMPTGSFCFTSHWKGGSQEAFPKVFFSAQEGDRKLRFSCHFFLQWAEAHEKFFLMWLLFSHQPLSLHPEALKKSKSDGFLGMLICWHKEMCWGNSLPALVLFETSTEHLSTSHLIKQNHKLHQGDVSCTVPSAERAEAQGALQKEQIFFFWWINLPDLWGFSFCASSSFMQVSTSKPHWYPCWVEGFFHPSKYFLFSFIEERASSVHKYCALPGL